MLAGRRPCERSKSAVDGGGDLVVEHPPEKPSTVASASHGRRLLRRMLDNQIPAAIHSALRAFKRPPPGEHLIKNDTQRVDIRIGAHDSVAFPLRRCVTLGVEPHTGPRTVP